MTVNMSLLLGAGVSVPAGLLSTGEITKKIFSDEIKENKHLDNEIFLFLRTVYNRVDSFFVEREISYEDIYHVIIQVRDFLKEYENPVVLSFVESLKDDFCNIRQGDIYKEKEISTGYLAELAAKGSQYIDAVIAYYLSNNNIDLTPLNFLKEIVFDKRISGINIFTLNHDLLLEQFLAEKEIDYYDGFEKEYSDNRIRVWKPDFKNTEKRIKLLKLHGSINWYKFRSKCADKYSGFYFASLDHEYFFTKNQDIFSVIENNPLILTGKINKILEYNRSIYVDLHYNFYNLLPQSSILLISGYSFNDKGVNSWLLDWLYSDENHKIYLIHPEPETCIQKAGVEIKNNWNKWLNKGKVVNIHEAVEDFSWKAYSERVLTNR